MRKLFIFLLLAPLAFAQSPFDGTWKANVQNAQFPDKPDVLVLQNGTYTCESCIPKVTAKADGTDQPVAGSPYYDTVNVKMIDDHTIQRITKKNGKMVGDSKLSASGDTLTEDFTTYPQNSDKPVTGKVTYTRVAKGPSGANQISGSWKTTKFESLSDNAITWTLKSTGDGWTMTSPTGASYTAKFDGKDYPFKGDPGITSVSLKRIDNNTVEETDKRDGKPLYVSRLTVGSDGKTMNVEFEDKEQGTKTKYSAQKQ